MEHGDVVEEKEKFGGFPKPANVLPSITTAPADAARNIGLPTRRGICEQMGDRSFGYSASPDNCMKFFSAISRFAGRAFGARRTDKPSRSQLVGMYLSQANSRDAYSPEFQENRQRRNGKYSTNRERA